MSGRNVSIKSPAAENRCAVTAEARYPSLSTNPAEARSTESWMMKLTVISIVILLSGMCQLF